MSEFLKDGPEIKFALRPAPNTVFEVRPCGCCVIYLVQGRGLFMCQQHEGPVMAEVNRA